MPKSLVPIPLVSTPLVPTPLVPTPLVGVRGVMLAAACALAVAVLAQGLPAGELQAQAAQASPAQSQGEDEGRPRGSISGAVVDAVSGVPVQGASVVLQPEILGAFPGPATNSAFAAASRAVTSDARGHYHFALLPAGVYRIYVSRVSYRPYSVVVELRGGSESAVSIGLNSAPIPLDPMEANSQRRGPYAFSDAEDRDVDLARMLASDLRRHRYLTTDVRELTQADVSEAVTLGEPDIFRALQRLPGVSTRSDYTAELWTRGAPWSQTRVYYDGIPLFNPLHALGIVSGVSSSTVGAVWFHPGVRSGSIGEGAAGVVDLQSRTAAGGGELNAQGDLSLMTAGIALDQRVLDGRAGWMLSGRHTYLDWLSELARRAGQRDEVYPFSFGDLSGKVDAWLGSATSVEGSFLVERDRLSNAPLDADDPLKSEWGNTLGRVSLNTRKGRLNIRHTVGASVHESRVVPDVNDPIVAGTPWRMRSESGVQYRGLTGSFWPEPNSVAGPGWTFGYALEEHRVRYAGPAALPVPRTATLEQALYTIGSTPSMGSLQWNHSLPMAAAWGEKTWTPDDRWSVRGGVRLEGGAPVMNAGHVRVSPRFTARFTPLPEVAMSAGFGRVFQYTQAVAPGGVHLASLVSTDVWMLAGKRVPAIQSDMITFGLESWIAPGRMVSLNLFTRRSTGVAVPDPRPGSLLGRPPFVIGENDAYGAEISLRQIMGPLTGSASYSLSRSWMEAEGQDYPSGADRVQVLNATLMYRARPSLKLGGAFTAATGVPFTRMISNQAECAEDPFCDAGPSEFPWVGDPHALRAPHFASLDLLVDWTVRHRGMEFGVYGQLRNVLGRDNATVYAGDPNCQSIQCANDDLQNLNERGIPRLPVIGIRVRR